MKILLDHNMWPGLWSHLEQHEVESTRRKGWQEIRNGELIRLAESDGFEAILTFDRRFVEELGGEEFHLRILVLRRREQNRSRLVRVVPDILATLDRMSPGQVEELDIEKLPDS